MTSGCVICHGVEHHACDSDPMRADVSAADAIDSVRNASSGFWNRPVAGSIGDNVDIGIGFQEKNSARSAELMLLRHKLLGKGKCQATPEDVLFLVLCHVVSEFDSRELAKRLLNRFKTIGKILVAREDHVLSECGGNEECLALLRGTHLLMRIALLASAENGITFKSVADIFDYLKITTAYETNEVFRILFLDAKNSLIVDSLHSEGTINHVPVYPREVIRSVLEHNAMAIILVHNHPSGGHQPSTADIDMTNILKHALHSINVKIHDHIIVTAQRCISMHLLGLV